MAHQKELSPTVFLDKMKRVYRPMSILDRREQEKYFFRLKTAVNYGTVKRQAGTSHVQYTQTDTVRNYKLTIRTVWQIVRGSFQSVHNRKIVPH